MQSDSFNSTPFNASSTSIAQEVQESQPSQSSMSTPTTKSFFNKRKPTEKPPKAHVQRSWVWDHITKVTMKETQEIMKDGKKEKVEVNVLKAHCNYCGQLFVCDTGGHGTSTFQKHILKVCKKYVLNDEMGQKVLGGSSATFGDVKKSMLVTKGWSQEECVKGIVEFIVIDEMPFSVVEKEGFRKMMDKVQPRLVVPSRRTIVREFLHMYDNMKDKLRAEISRHMVSLTTDTWTSVQNVNYIVVTAHFVDDEWIMHKKIISFCPITSHSGKEIAKMIEQCLVECKIQKLMCISVDNASANKIAIEWLVDKLLEKRTCPLILEGKYMHVRCLAHIVNLIVKDGLKILDKSVMAIRNAVKFVRSSPKRLNSFKECMKSENLDSKGLVVMDVPTRWNSTYMMIESALKYKKVFGRLSDEEDNGYISYFKDRDDLDVVEEEELEKRMKGKIGPPGDRDWESAHAFASFLKVFYLVTVKVSASKHPTSHTAVHDVIAIDAEINKLFLPINHIESSACRNQVEGVIRDMGASMRAKYQKYFGSIGSINPLFVVALVLDPRFKLRHFLHLCKKHLGFLEQDVEEKSIEVKTLMKELCDEYNQLTYGSQKKNKHATADYSNSSEKNSSASSETLVIFDEMMDDWEKELEDTEDVALAHEVDRYLLDHLEKSKKGEMFDILKWWKLKGRNTYPTLALIAKDVLAIQVSTVASESAFSTEGRVVDPFRSSLTPRSVESLICLQNWIRGEDISNIEYEASEQEIEFYQQC